MGTVLKEKPFTEQVKNIVDVLQNEFPPEYWLTISSNEAMWVAMLTLCGPRNVAQVISQSQIHHS